jgi:hypothetical protein
MESPDVVALVALALVLVTGMGIGLVVWARGVAALGGPDRPVR